MISAGSYFWRHSKLEPIIELLKSGAEMHFALLVFSIWFLVASRRLGHCRHLRENKQSSQFVSASAPPSSSTSFIPPLLAVVVLVGCLFKNHPNKCGLHKSSLPTQCHVRSQPVNQCQAHNLISNHLEDFALLFRPGHD